MSTGPNSKGYLKLAFLESMVGVALKVGKESLSEYILPLYITLINDSEEVVIVQTLHVLNQLL